MLNVCVAFKAHLGWTNAVAVDTAANRLTVVHAQRIDIARPGDREALEPLHLAAGFDGLERVPPPPDAQAFIQRALKKQAHSTLAALRTFARDLLANDIGWQRAVMLTGRSYLPDDAEHPLDSHAHVHVAEGAAVRNSIRAALANMHIPCTDQDEKNTNRDGQAALQLTGAALEVLLKAARPAQARNWRAEDRVLALAAWLHRG